MSTQKLVYMRRQCEIVTPPARSKSRPGRFVSAAFYIMFLQIFFFYTPGQVSANVDKECRVRRTSDGH